MYQLHNRFIIWIIAAVLLVGVGCSTTPPPTFYQLDEPANTMLSGLMRGVAIGVGPVNLPAYLDRPQIVTRATDHKLNLSEFNRWAEPLKESVTRVIGVNLSNLLETTRIYRVARRNKELPLDFRIELDIPRFDGKLGGDILLVARWSLYGSDEKVLMTKVSIITEPSGGEGYDNLITAQNRALQALSREIADAVKSNS